MAYRGDLNDYITPRELLTYRLKLLEMEKIPDLEVSIILPKLVNPIPIDNVLEDIGPSLEGMSDLINYTVRK